MDERYDYLTELAGQGQVPINDAFFEMLGVQEGVEAQRAVGPYTPTEKIGQGAAGDVWLAQDPEGNLVAIKILRDRDSVPAPVADVRRARFLREAETLQKLDHPNIVRVYSIQEHNDCLSFVMEYVDGSNLKNELTVSGTISPERTLEILDQVLDAVEYAHKKGIIHRDIKPANILLTSDGKVKLCDFGIAHIKNEETMLTQDGTIVGSYGYLSPEQAYCYRVRKQSDLFSVAVVAYEMVTGTNPFWKDTQQEMLKAIPFQGPCECVHDRWPRPGQGVCAHDRRHRAPRLHHVCQCDGQHRDLRIHGSEAEGNGDACVRSCHRRRRHRWGRLRGGELCDRVRKGP